MKVGRRTVFMVILAALAALVLYLALRNPQASLLPADETHAGMVIIQECMSCHGPDEGAPQGPNHPISRQCMSCHSR
ncbi:hypothetical protein DRQ53_14905 [bacterium]|nr:MAG: hypothetical protein DRQ53_14905 [bacterium]